jgi:hypothetical protein
VSYEEFKTRRAFAQKLGQKGWLYPTYPKEYGGGGMDAYRSIVLNEELAKRNLSLPIVMDWTMLAAPAIIVCATEEQRKRYLPPLLRGEALTWQLMTEPETGTDVASQKTKALRHVRDKDHFIINGQKTFVGGLGRIPRNYIAQSFLDHCKNNPKIARRLKENPHLLDSVVNIYIFSQVERLLALRNGAGKGGPLVDFKGFRIISLIWFIIRRLPAGLPMRRYGSWTPRGPLRRAFTWPRCWRAMVTGKWLRWRIKYLAV